MRTASDDMRVQPATSSWRTLTAKLDQHQQQKRSVYRIGIILARIAAILLIAAGFWWVLDGQQKSPPLTSELVNDNPAYFASYLDVAQSLQDQMSRVEGPGNAGFKESFSNMPTTGDSSGSL